MRLTRIFIVSLFVFLFSFGIQSPVFAQSTLCPDAIGATQTTACEACRRDVPPGHANDAACKHWIDTWGNNAGNLPKEIPPYICGLAAGYGVKCSVNSTDPRLLNMNMQVHYNLTGGYIMADFASRIGGAGVTQNGQVVFGPQSNGTQLAYKQDGVMGSLVNATSAIAVLPVSSNDYIADVIQTIKNPLGAQPAYAQGLGFSSLKPVLGLWKLFRNVAYFFFVIIFIVIGFLIMFRSKIGGQAAVTVQQALPKIIVALLLVTFSYAIAGFMIDLMYLVIYLMIGIFSADGTLKATDLVKIAFTDHLFNNISQLITGGVVATIGGSIGNAVSSMLVDSGWKDATASFAGLGASIIFTLVMLIALLVNMFKLFFALLQAYVMVLFAVIFAPIQLLMGALPGQNTFSAWLKGLLSNLMAFPVVIFFLLCAQYFSVTKFGTDGAGGFAAPQLGLQNGGGANAGTFILAILQFGILALIPKAIEIAKGAVNGKLDIDPGKAMGEMWKQGGGSALTKTALMAPLAGAGAIAGYKYATDRANKLGLEGGARRLAQAGGILGGGGIGFNALRSIKTVVPGAINQLAQTQVTESYKEIKQAADSRRAEAENLRQVQMLAAQKARLEQAKTKATDQQSGTIPPTAPVGAKSKAMGRLE